MAKTLNTNVSHAGVWYRPGYRVGDQIPEDIADKITNPRVWDYTDDDDEPKPEEPKSTTGARLVARVAVAGVWYGPDDDVPDDVARRITNPKVWEGGKAPTFDTGSTDAAKADNEVEQPAGDTADQAQKDETETAESEDAGERRPARRPRRA